MGSHVTSALMGRLPVPRPETQPALARRLARLAALLRQHPEDSPAAVRAYIDVQAGVAKLYAVPAADFAGMVSTFPLLPSGLKDAIGTAYDALR
jgi:hypothetical protein